MSMGKVINIRDHPNWRKEGAVYIGRGSPFGNPFKIGKGVTREDVIEQYKQYFNRRVRTDMTFLNKVVELKGKTLACYCAPLPCHGDVILEFLET